MVGELAQREDEPKFFPERSGGLRLANQFRDGLLAGHHLAVAADGLGVIARGLAPGKERHAQNWKRPPRMPKRDSQDSHVRKRECSFRRRVATLLRANVESACP